MYCTWCINYKLKKKTSAEPNFIKGTSNFQKSTKQEHLSSQIHPLARDFYEISNNHDVINKDNNQIEIPELFKSNREKLQFELILPLFKNIFFIAKQNLSFLKFEALNSHLDELGLEYNENYRNRVSGKEMLGYIAWFKE